MHSFLSKIVIASLTLATPLAPLAAQAGSAISAGMPVVDAQGGAVGTVAGATGDIVVVKTDRHEVSLPKASFTVDQGKLLLGMTQAELNAAFEKSLADAAAALVAGAPVKGSGGENVGTIESIDAEFATIKLSSGKQVRVPRSGLGASAEGAVIGLTADQLEAQAQPAPDAAAK